MAKKQKTRVAPGSVRRRNQYINTNKKIALIVAAIVVLLAGILLAVFIPRDKNTVADNNEAENPSTQSEPTVKDQLDLYELGIKQKYKSTFTYTSSGKVQMRSTFRIETYPGFRGEGEYQPVRLYTYDFDGIVGKDDLVSFAYVVHSNGSSDPAQSFFEMSYVLHDGQELYYVSPDNTDRLVPPSTNPVEFTNKTHAKEHRIMVVWRNYFATPLSSEPPIVTFGGRTLDNGKFFQGTIGEVNLTIQDESLVFESFGHENNGYFRYTDLEDYDY